MYRKRIYVGLLAGWLGVLGLSVYAILVRNEVVNNAVVGAAVADVKPIADAYLAVILMLSLFILLLVGLYFSIQHRH